MIHKHETKNNLTTRMWIRDERDVCEHACVCVCVCVCEQLYC